MNMEQQIDYLKRNLKIAKILKKADSLLVLENLSTLALTMVVVVLLLLLEKNWISNEWFWFTFFALFCVWMYCYYKSFDVQIGDKVPQQKMDKAILELKNKGLYEQFLSEPLFTNIDKFTQLQYHNIISDIMIKTLNKIKDLKKEMKNEQSKENTKLNQAEQKFLDLTQNQAFIARILYNQTSYNILDAVSFTFALFFMPIAVSSILLIIMITYQSNSLLSFGFGLGVLNIVLITAILMYVTIYIFDKINTKISKIIGRKVISNRKLKKALAQIKAWNVYDVFMEEDVFKRITKSEKPILYSDIKYVFKQIENEIKEQYKIVQIEKSKERDKKIVKQQKEYIAMFAENKNSINLNKGNKK